MQMFSCEYCGIFMKTYFEEHLRTTASASYFFKWNCLLPVLFLFFYFFFIFVFKWQLMLKMLITENYL